ncbi:MAG TPA: hypothetical protein VKJ45_22125, partial [Blastocatellia bacterium]|nr:hypothetical protein [Blastocatellia bacterium]
MIEPREPRRAAGRGLLLGPSVLLGPHQELIHFWLICCQQTDYIALRPRYKNRPLTRICQNDRPSSDHQGKPHVFTRSQF